MSNGEAVATPGDGALSNSVAGIREEVMNHPAGLFVLFFTEMWERFSYYGMRALLVLFLVAGISDGGWGWERADALILFGWYGSLVYLTPLIGGVIADKLTGYRNAVVIGALLMTLGHGSLALESEWSFYLGLLLLILGNGMFKPNISTIVGDLYKGQENKKDSAYTIFYMGINAGAFLGIMLCGYVGETVGWHYGFGLAGIFMFFGLLQFYFSKKLFGHIGEKGDPSHLDEALDEEGHEPEPKVVRERLFVVGIFAFFTIFFWMAFEQAAGSMTIFASDYTQRTLTGIWATVFTWTNFLLTVVPIIIVTAVLYMLFKRTFKYIPLSNALLATSFAIIWGIVIWKVANELTADTTEVPASWFGILNSFFIIALAPLFSKFWAGKGKGISGPTKFALGLILLGSGFGFLAYGAASIPAGAQTAAVSMVWLVLAYFMHTVGELCLSPVGLSYVNKLSPKRLMSTMFGIWFLSSFVAHLLAGYSGSVIDSFSAEYSMSGFFLLFTGIPVFAGIVMYLLKPKLVKWMHGVH
ncbi:peptide MFS transporter [Porticoccus sp. GXU_MW_L64]